MEYVLLSAPMHINWNYTYKCNFNCMHCYSRTRTDSKDLDTKSRIIIAKNIVKNKVFNVNLGGGEPRLCDDCLDIIDLLSSNNIRVNLSSNGWKTDKKTVRDMKKAGLGGVSISIDHIEPEIHDSIRNMPGSLFEVYESINHYIENEIDVTISTTITTQNIDCLEKIMTKSKAIGAKGIDLKRLKMTGNAKERRDLELNAEQVNRLYEIVREHKSDSKFRINLVYGETRIPNLDAGCPCGKTSLAILNNGDISPCVYNPYVIGNAITDDIHDIWCYSKELNYMREHFSCMGLRR